MWQCPKCGQQTTNPELSDKHVKSCQKVSKEPVLVGWQGLKLDGVPVSQKHKVPLSQLYEAWKNIQTP